MRKLTKWENIKERTDFSGIFHNCGFIIWCDRIFLLQLSDAYTKFNGSNSFNFKSSLKSAAVYHWFNYRFMLKIYTSDKWSTYVRCRSKYAATCGQSCFDIIISGRYNLQKVTRPVQNIPKLAGKFLTMIDVFQLWPALISFDGYICAEILIANVLSIY